ncbi:glycoprotein [Bat paramyxovirus]|uniref:Glycoprotein n=1 Tax=bat paramyxovirus 16797 TaxID=3070194 RepID=A0AA48FJN4_9MONO|nr:glycoprotein [Bat paramyxovirus]AYM47529.1 glycoprotein [bat paramyxovirus 16797]
MDKNYFGEYTNNNSGGDKSQNNTCTKVFIGISSTIGLLSILVIIALNITNLAAILSNKDKGESDGALLNQVYDVLNEIKTSFLASITPRITLINTATGFLIPALIKESTKTIQYEIYKYCSYQQVNPDQSCAEQRPVGHSSLFSLYDPSLILTCGTKNSIQPKGMTPVVFDSFIPSTTTLRGCTRIPTFSLGSLIFSYSHNQIAQGCGDSQNSNQDWIIGSIVDGHNNTPAFKIWQRWYFNDDINRKSCATAVSGKGAWLLCSIVTMSEAQDYRTSGIMDLFLGYQDAYGRRKFWRYSQNLINLDHDYAALYPSVGAGISVGGTVYFLVYGGLQEPIGGNAYCPNWRCPDSTKNQAVCNKAQQPNWLGGKQILNGILSFEDQIEHQPNITIRTIPVSSQIFGAEGRLYYTPLSHRYFIYVRSSSWYPNLQFGEINLMGDLSIKWANYTSLSRPGSGVCKSTNKCPAECVTGVYTDFYPLSISDGLGMTVELVGDTQRRGPTIKMVTLTNKIEQYILTTTTQTAAYTSTTCFMFNFQPWCISVVEMGPATIGSMTPVGFLYPIWSSCTAHSFDLPYSVISKPDSDIFGNHNLNQEIDLMPAPGLPSN